MLLVLFLYGALCCADAPAPKPSPRPSPKPIVVEPIDIVVPKKCTSGNDGIPGQPECQGFFDSRDVGCFYCDHYNGETGCCTDWRRWFPSEKDVPVSVPMPVPSPPPPSVLKKQNARGFHVDTHMGALVTMTGVAGTDVTPEFKVNTDGPLAFGDGRSLGRIGARLEFSTTPGQTITALDIKTYKSMGAAFWYGYVVGHLRDVDTTIVVEGGFATILKGSGEPEPITHLSRKGGIGVRFDARKSNASGTFLFGFDEASSTCPNTSDCTGIHSGASLMMYGQLPIAGGVLLFGDATLAISSSLAGVIQRVDILRVGMAVNPVEAVKSIKGK